MQTEIEWLRIERTFDAPIETVWAMWTDPNLFKKWYGPNGMSVPTAKMELKVGGTRKICMRMETPDRNMSMWFVGEFKEVSAPSRLVYTESMADENGNLMSPKEMGMPDGHPEITEVVVELSEHSGKTTMKMTHIGVPSDSQGAGGWQQAFEKMAVYIAEQKNP